MVVTDRKLAAVLRTRGIDPALMRVVALYFKDGWKSIITYDEDAVDQRIRELEEEIGIDAPLPLQRALRIVKAYHYDRRSRNMALEELVDG